MSDQNHDEDFLKAVLGFGCALLSILFAPVAIYGLLTWKSNQPIRSRGARLGLSISLFAGGILSWFAFFDPYPLYSIEFIKGSRLGIAPHWPLWMGRLGALWLTGFGLLHLMAPWMTLFKRQELGIRTHHFVKNSNASFRWTGMTRAFQKKDSLPLGMDIKSGEITQIQQVSRTAHLLGVGSTGTGKTTLMINMILHAVKHQQPCVVIDPKGEDSTLDEIIRLGRAIDPHFEDRFQLFSMSKPLKSSCYNPLKHGNANQLKDRIIEALTWSEPYYQSMSASFLTALTATTEYLNVGLNLDRISRLLTLKEVQAELLMTLKNRFQENATNHRALELMNLITPFFSKANQDTLSGLSSQISILNNPTFGGLLSFDSAESEIDFRLSRRSAGITYFQLDTLGNGDSARRLGRMIIEDLKSLASEVYRTDAKVLDRPFLPIYIDEFGSFASSGFIEFLKQSRGANFGVHLFCQGLEDLDIVSPEFRRQVISNTLTKVGLRMDDHETVNEICATAGTFDALEQSHQVQGVLFATKTGMGNLRETKQMKIEHDVFKQLRVGEAVVIQKSPQQVSGIRIPMATQFISVS